MTKPAKLYLNLLANRNRTVAFRDFEALLTAFGFNLRRITSSHRNWKHPSIPLILTINPDGKDAHRYQVDKLLDWAEEYGLTIQT